MTDPGVTSSIRIFAPDAINSAKPTRFIHGPHTRLWHPFGLAIDESGNLYVANAVGIDFHAKYQRTSSVLVFAPKADGDAAPIREIVGPRTRLSAVRAIAVGSDGYIYVSGGHNLDNLRIPFFINVYAPKAAGDQPPVRRIAGEAPTSAEFTDSLTQGQEWIKKNRLDKVMTGDPGDLLYELHNSPRLNRPAQMALDHAGNLWVANINAWRITEYAPGASGNVKPIRVIEGDKTGLLQPAGIAVDGDGNVYVSNFGAQANEYCSLGM